MEWKLSKGRINPTNHRRIGDPAPAYGMVWPPGAFYDEPDLNDVLWRYIDLAKLISLLKDEALYLPPASALSDPYEGGYPVPAIKDMEERGQATYLGWHWRKSQESVFISCWHHNRKESDAMWRLYTSRDEAVAIRTTYQAFFDSVDETRLPLDLGRAAFTKVMYLGFDEELPPDYVPTSGGTRNFVYKDRSFAHEQEIRLIAADPDLPNGVGLVFPVRVRTLIQEIYVSPYAPPWLFGVVRSLMDTYGHSDIPVVQSALDRRNLLP